MVRLLCNQFENQTDDTHIHCPILMIVQFQLLMQLALVAAALPLVPQLLYWNSILPNKLMPKALSELVQPGLSLYLQPQTQESSLIPPFYLGTLSDQPLTVSYKKDDVAATDNVFFGYNQDAATAAADKLFFGHNQNVVTAADNIFFGDNHEAAVGNQLLKDPTQKVFFLEKDVQPGTTMKYSLARNSTRATFLHRKTAESIPFSSTKLPDILNQFSLVKDQSLEEKKDIAPPLWSRWLTSPPPSWEEMFKQSRQRSKGREQPCCRSIQ
ncbi:PREDICTED: BURP [Prunus dulcis]|uniref:PREDICTED: BURP n=1 Tax=Prunus dulcis TaxID=3755 RepID=A0A5E4EGF4_PRUDU|nr:PREDICTED: BURP [Prunus dulcis]